MPSIRDEYATSARIHYAATCLLADRVGSPGFDTCFEMWDGDYVLEGLCRRTRCDEVLAAKIAKYFCPVSTAANHARLKHIPDRALVPAARRYLDERKRPQLEFNASHVDDFVSGAAWGDWHEKVPAGMVMISAFHARDGVQRYFLVTRDEYDRRGEFGLVVDPARHTECDGP